MSVKETRIEGYNLGAVAGQAHERERIIKLLEDDAENRTQYCKPLDAEHCPDCFESVRLIALIKGQQK